MTAAALGCRSPRRATKHHSTSGLRRALAVCLATVTGLVGVLSQSSPAGAVGADLESVIEQQFILQINAERAARGVGPVSVQPDLTSASRSWSDQMGSSNTLAHSSDGRAEIVGYGGNSGQITDAFMRSPGHRHLIVDPNLTFAGAGATCDRSGRLWITVQFRRLDTSLPTLSSSPASPIVTPATEGSTCQDSANVGGVRRLYAAFFRRESDSAGLQYWVGQRDRGVSLAAIAEHFVSSTEFRHNYGSLSDRDFVDLVYRNVLGRSPDQAGYDYWVGRLRTDLDRGGLMVGFSEGPEFVFRTGIA